MLRVYNKSALTQKERFSQALLYGIAASIALVVLYVLINNLLIGWQFQVVYIGFGYAIGYVIQKFGRGVQVKFSILSAVLCFLVILLGDTLTYFPSIISQPTLWFKAFSLVIAGYLNINFSSLIGLLFRVSGIYFAFINGRII